LLSFAGIANTEVLAIFWDFPWFLLFFHRPSKNSFCSGKNLTWQ